MPGHLTASRRILLRAAGALALAPVGAMAPLRPDSRYDLPDGAPICQVGDTAPAAVTGPLGKLDSLTRLQRQAELVRIWRDRGFTALLVTHDVEEALLLAGRVIVVSDRPARIRADLKITLDYPRHRDDPKLVQLRRDVLGQLGLSS